MKAWKRIALIALVVLLILLITSRFLPIGANLLWFIALLDNHNGLVTAIATVFVAGFTWTLWRSNEAIIAQAQSTGDLAEKQFLMEGRQADLVVEWAIAREHFSSQIVLDPRIGWTHAPVPGK